MVQRIVFDLDDTLIDSGKYYRRQLEEFADLVTDHFPVQSTEEVLKLQRTVDRKALDDLGLDKQRFPRSLSRTWQEVCQHHGRQPDPDQLKTVENIGWKVYETIPESLPGMRRLLDRLDQDYELVLYTMGDSDIQRPKIDQHNLRQWFTKLHIVPDKNRHYLSSVVKPFKPSQVMIVGDSLRGEIKPGLELGLKTLHRQTNHSWHYQDVEISKDFPTITRLNEIPNYLP